MEDSTENNGPLQRYVCRARWCISCFHAGKPHRQPVSSLAPTLSLMQKGWWCPVTWLLANNSADSLCLRSDLRDKSDFPLVAQRLLWPPRSVQHRNTALPGVEANLVSEHNSGSLSHSSLHREGKEKQTCCVLDQFWIHSVTAVWCFVAD